MELSEAIQKRHSVRSYEERAIEKNTRDQLLSFIDQCNQESGLHMQLVLDEPKGFAVLWPITENFPELKITLP